MPTSRDAIAVFFGAQYAVLWCRWWHRPRTWSKSDERLRTIGNMLRSVQASRSSRSCSLLDMLTSRPGRTRLPLHAGVRPVARGNRPPVAAAEADTIGVIQFSSGSPPIPSRWPCCTATWRRRSARVLDGRGRPRGVVAADVPRHGLDRRAAVRHLPGRSAGG